MKKLLSIITCVILVLTISFAFSACKNSDEDGQINQDGGKTDNPGEHTHNYIPSVTTEPTCTEEGVKTYRCSCNDSYSQPIAANGHNYVDGVCSVCGDGAVKTTSYTVYFKNEENWESVSVSIWRTVGEETTDYADAWPGSAMTKVEGSDDWYSYTVELDVTEGVQLVFNNGLAEGGSQTGDLNFSAENLWWAGGTAFATKEAAEEPDPISITVYYNNLNGWETPYVQAWNESSDINSWPGIAMTEVEGNEGWYTATFETLTSDGVGYVFNDGSAEGGEQSGDVIYNAEKLYYSGFDSFASVSEAENATLAEATVYFRNTNDWETPYINFWRGEGDTYEKLVGGVGLPMTKVEGSDDWYSYTIKILSLDSIRYLFCDGTTGDDAEFTANIFYDAEKPYYSGSNSYASMDDAEADSETQYADLYVYGTGSYWGKAQYQFALDGSGNSCITLELAEGFEFKIASSNWSVMIVYAADNAFGDDPNFDWGDDYGIKVVNAGTYTFTVAADGTVTIEKA